MRPVHKLALAVVSATLTFGCASTASTDLARAASDLQCPDDEVTITSHGDKYIASGCGRQIAYENFGPRTLANPGKRP